MKRLVDYNHPCDVKSQTKSMKELILIHISFYSLVFIQFQHLYLRDHKTQQKYDLSEIGNLVIIQQLALT